MARQIVESDQISGSDERPTRTDARGKRYPLSRVREALAESGGAISVAAKALGCHRETIYKFMERHPELVKVRDAAARKSHEVFFEVADNAFKRAAAIAQRKVERGETKLTRFEVKALELFGTKTRRGREMFATRTEMVGKDGGPIETADVTPAMAAKLVAEHFRSPVAIAPDNDPAPVRGNPEPEVKAA